MIKEIVQFTKALPENTFSRNLQLREGLYIFLDVREENGKAVLKNVDEEGNLVKEDYGVFTKNSEMNPFFEECLQIQNNSIPVSPAKIFNPNKKIYGASCSPFVVSFIKKNFVKYEKELLIKELSDQYFKKASIYVDEKLIKRFRLFKDYLEEDIYKLLYDLQEFKDAKDSYSVNLYLKSVTLSEYIEAHNRYLKDNVFNKEDYNATVEEETFGISDSLSGFNDKKRFLKHQTSLSKFNFRIKGKDSLYLWKYFKLQKNGQLPNPCPIFINSDELNKATVRLHQDGKVLSHAQLIKELLKNPEEELSNFYLIYFQAGLKGSKIIDIDFVPQFKYKVEQLELKEIFSLGGTIEAKKITNVFQLQNDIFNTIFNRKLCPNEGWIRYFDDIEPDLKYHFTDEICSLMLQYRKSIYDYIYKSRHESITCSMFDKMMKISILEDIRIDEYKNEQHSRGYAIKEKLNLWFSLYNFFNQNQNREDMASKIPELLEKMKQVANGENISFSENPAEFAFGAGQLVYFLLTKSAASNKSYAMLEPFLQKTNVSQLQNAISNSIAMYKHEIDISKGRFEKLASEVLAYESDINMKDYLRYFLAGCFAQSVIYEKKEKKETESTD
jgi:CRISPR-associated protein Csh1